MPRFGGLRLGWRMRGLKDQGLQKVQGAAQQCQGPAGRTKESQRESVKKANCKTSSKQTSNIRSWLAQQDPPFSLKPSPFSTHKVATRSQTTTPTLLKLVNRKCNSMHLMLATVAEWKSVYGNWSVSFPNLPPPPHTALLSFSH